jgi:hypothetical protein
VSAGSNAAQLSLKTVATVTGDPVTSLTRCAGATASFSVTAMGTAPLSYEWRKGGAPMGAPNLATLFFANVHPADAGSYSCLVSNECGSDLSAAGSLIVRGEGFADEPDGQCASSGETVVFSAQATNVNGVTVFWSWYRNGMGLANDPPHITGAGTNTLTISNVTPADAADYSAVIITTSPTVCINESTPAPLLVDTCPECATPGDMDGDGDVDLRDMQQFALCYGSGAGLVPGCECADTASNSFDVNTDD